MTIQRYELLDLTSDDGPRAMVNEYEEGSYVLHADHAVEVAALKARIAELESERDDDQLLNKYAVCISGSVTQYVYSRVNCDAQSVYDRLVDRHHYNPDISVHFVACEVERGCV